MQIITLFSFCIIGFLFGPQSQAAETTKIIKTFAESTEKVELATGSGQIKGQLFDADTQQTIDAGLTFEAFLYHKLPRLGQWVYASSVEVVDGGFTFDALPDGQYAVYVIWQGANEYEQVEKPYIPAVWSNAGTQEMLSYFPRQFNGSNAIRLNEGDNSKALNFYLEQGALFELIHDGNLNYSDYGAYAYSEDLNDGKFRNPFFTVIKTQIGNNGQGTSQTHHVFVLPEAKYQFYDDHSIWKGHVLGWGDCQHCRYEIHQGNGEKVDLQIGLNPSRQIPLSIKQGKITGKLIGDIDKNYINATRVGDTDSEYGEIDQNGNITFSHLDEGYYYLNLNTVSGGLFPQYSYLLGGSYCLYLTCNFDDGRLFKVGRNTSIPPIYEKQGGFLTVSISDNLSEDGYLLPENPHFAHNLHWISIYDEDYNFVTDKQIHSVERISIPAGNYYLRTGNPIDRYNNRGYVNQVYPNIECLGHLCDMSQGEMVTVKDGENTDNINFELNRGHVVSGAIFAEDHNYLPIAHARVEVYDENERFLMDIDALSDGTFAIGGLQDGRYYLKTSNGNKYKQNIEYKQEAVAWLDEAYPNTPCPNNACDFAQAELIEVNGEDLTGINFNLKKTIGISGFVKDERSGSPVKDATVHVHSENGERIGSYISDSIGWFATNGLAVDSQIKNYLLTVEGGPLYYNQTVGGVHCIYGLCSPEQAAAVELNGEPITIELKHKKQVDEKYSGMFYNAEESGHGLQFEVISQSEGQVLNVAWFAHKDGEPMWLTGTGMLLGNRAFVDLQITDGTEFPASKNGQYWGTLRVTFTDLHHADLMWDTQFEGFESGELSVERLTVVSEATESDQETTDFSACMSGSYYDPERSGEGALIEILGEPEDRLLFTWYTYKGDKQFWITGSDYFDGDEFTTQVYYSRGVGFTPDFDASAVETVIWGDVKLKRISMSEVAMLLTPNAQHAADFDVKSTTLTRLTVISGDDGACGLQ